MQIAHNDERLSWQGCISVEHGDGWSQAWRLPHTQRSLFPPDGLMGRASMPAGARIAFLSNTRSVTVHFDQSPERAPIDLCCDGRFVGSRKTQDCTEARFDDLPASTKRIELWLPHFEQFRFRGLTLDDGAGLTPAPERGRKWITYGSSISHCRLADSPTQTWPALVARQRGLDLLCLGLGGQCHLDSMIARLIRDRPADAISMCVGINIHSGSMGVRTFRGAIIGFVQTIREKHPTTPLAVISPILSPPRETPTEAPWTLPRMREEVQAAVEALREHGDQHVRYFNGLELFGPELEHLLPDQLHPNNEGYFKLSENFLNKVAPFLFA
jgi:hypothetical protein